MRIAAALAALLLASTAAQATIRINDARYEDGALTVTGQARPNHTVVLDQKFRTKSDGAGHFEFKVPKYRPQYCMSDITAGDDSYSAVIAGCLLLDAQENFSTKAGSKPAAK